MAQKAKSAQKVRFFYIKGNHFRVVHVDGALGAVTPRGLIHCAIYSERQAIPQVAEHDFSPEEGRLSELPVSEEGKKGIVRELDIDLIMTKQTAAELRDWLAARIVQLEGIEKEMQKRKAPRKGRKKHAV
jgi:hypothetical protein